MTHDDLTDAQRLAAEEVKRLTSIGNEHYDAGRFHEAAPLYRQALEKAEAAYGDSDPAFADALVNVANVQYVQEKFQEADAAYSRAISIYEQSSPDSHKLSSALVWLADARFRSQQYDEAKEPYVRAISILEKRGEDEQLATVLMDLAHLHYFVGEYLEAEPLYLRVLRLRESALGVDDIAVAHSLSQLARMYKFGPEFEKDPEPLMQRVVEIEEKVLGPEHADLAESLYRLADFYKDKRRNAEAEPLYVRAMKILDAHPELGELETRWMRSGYMDYLRETGRDDEANTLDESWGEWRLFEDMVRGKVSKEERTLGPDDPQLATSLVHLANYCLYEDKTDEAESHYLRALAIQEKAFGIDNEELATSLTGLAKVYRVTDRLSETEDVLNRAATILEKTIGAESSEFAYLVEQRALLAEQRKDLSTAEALYEQALDICRGASGTESRDYAETLFHFACLYRRHENVSGVERTTRELVQLSEKEIEVADLEKGDYFELRIWALEQLGQIDDAGALKARVKKIMEENEVSTETR